MSGRFRFVFLNSLLIYISGFILTTIIHESGHFIAYWISGVHVVLYHNHVSASAEDLSLTIKVVAALAGPFISLVQGVIFSLIIFRKQSNTNGYLFSLWAGLLGFINFFGYLMLTPFSTAGDTGKAAQLLQLPSVYQFLISVAGIAILIFIMIKMGYFFSNFIPKGTGLPEKRKYINALILYPILAGSLVNVLLAFPVPVLLSVIYPATSSYAVLSAYRAILKAESIFNKPAAIETRIPVGTVLLTGLAIIVNRLLTIGFG